METATAAPESASTSTLESFNPATGELVGSVPTIGPEQVQAVVDDVARIQPAWAELPLKTRAAYMRRAAEALLDDIDEVAELLTREQGKPLTEAYTMEVLPTIDALHWCAKAGPKVLANEKVRMTQAFTLSKRAHFSYEPIGVVGVIAPWNYPWSIPFGEVAIALMAGNGVVLKPASLTPLLGERIRAVFEKAGFPEGLVRVVHGGGAVGEALARSSAGKIFFTGSVEVGRHVGAVCAAELKGSVLELGGKDPMIVCADADLGNAVSGAVWGGFANAGQTCSGIERVYVLREVADRFVEGVVREAQALKLGDTLEWETAIGPMTSEGQYEIVVELIEDAVAAGATKHCGGPTEVPGMSGKFIAPTVLTGVTHEMRIMKEEIFGPVLPIVVVDSEQEAIELANDSEFGLGASVWTKDRQRGERIARRIESGMVWINDHSFSHGACQCSWGGVKDSGLGRSHSKFGFYECVNIKLNAWEPGLARDFWWHPYDRTLGEAIRASAKALYGKGATRTTALREGAGPLLRVGRRTLRKRGPGLSR
ncbi:MAG TPA: aldehyde dehydrogenase family protein [Solirubrobacterales bacterium]|jgi:succinate-semialdehyde dehydrogenase/glutarate-semialdehyde dehydrogenase|nr:aldehyde dehydrogenase family protein [Solirubrobacterales bacterium]